jgi:CBS domain-containing protein
MTDSASTARLDAGSLADGRLSPAALRWAIGAGPSADALVSTVADIRRLVQTEFVARGDVLATTRRYAQINDLVTERLVRSAASELGLDLGQACWLAFGSQGRGEQTPATDQDNGLVFCSTDPASERARWLELGQRVNRALDDCGYRLCKGGVMAGEPGCCLTLDEWCDRFDTWISHGAPADLLHASIHFDLRALVGRADLAALMRQRIAARAATLPRFLKQMADNALRHPAALNWLGQVRSQRRGGCARFDLKLHGTAIFVETARLYALAHGIEAVGTLERLHAVAQVLRVPAHESDSWRAGFVGLQRLRLQAQADRGELADNPNLIAMEALGPLGRQLLKQGLQAARLLQQRTELDYGR